MQPKDILREFIECMRSQDFERAIQYLAHEDFQYIGPNMVFNNPNDMLAYLFGMASIQKDIVLRQLFGEADQAFAAIDYKTYYEPIGDVRIAVWINVDAGVITKVECFYNAAVVENMLDITSPINF